MRPAVLFPFLCKRFRLLLCGTFGGLLGVTVLLAPKLVGSLALLPLVALLALVMPRIRATLPRVLAATDDRLDRGAERRLLWQARHDTLTRLPNLNLLNERLEDFLLLSQSRPVMGALISIDLDDFGAVNDSLKYHCGDQALTEVARRLTATVRDTDTVARVGGDRFAVLLAPLASAGEGSQIARALFERLGETYRIDDQQLFLTASVGVTLLPVPAAGVGELLQRADAACGAAKSAGGNRIVFFEPSINARAHRRFQVETALRHALADGQLSLCFQPIVEVATAGVAGFEALLRWEHPELGFVAPAEFVPIAEDTGEIVAIGLWAVRRALQVLDALARAGFGDVRVSVNISPRQLRRIEDVADLLQALRVGATQRLTIEITESLLLEDHQLGADFLTQARALGARIALDDFGAGYSSISYLRDYRFDLLKIDRAFVRRIATEPANRGIVAGIVALGKAMSLEVVAEGVESAVDLEALRLLGTTKAQGFYFARPMREEKLAGYLRRGALA